MINYSAPSCSKNISVTEAGAEIMAPVEHKKWDPFGLKVTVFFSSFRKLKRVKKII
jgi:hypothetical protein